MVWYQDRSSRGGKPREMSILLVLSHAREVHNMIFFCYDIEHRHNYTGFCIEILDL